MLYRILILCLLLPSLAIAQAQPDIQSSLIKSIEAGVICAPESVGERIAPGTVGGTTHIIEESPPFVSNSRRVPAVLGIGFGIKSLAAVEAGLSGVTMRVTHPPMGPSGATEQTFDTAIRGNDPSLTFYQFDYTYELLPGLWTMEALIDDTVIYRQTFNVRPPAEVPELARVCGFEDLLS